MAMAMAVVARGYKKRGSVKEWDLGKEMCT
jgi:hypothetical protein